MQHVRNGATLFVFRRAVGSDMQKAACGEYVRPSGLCIFVAAQRPACPPKTSNKQLNSLSDFNQIRYGLHFRKFSSNLEFRHSDTVTASVDENLL